MNSPSTIAWLIPPVTGTWLAYLAVSNWREWRRNRKASR